MPDLMNYRSKLYSNYSSRFSRKKTQDSIQVETAFENWYPRFLHFPKDVTVADIGCGKVEWLRWLLGHGYSNLCGVDLCHEDLNELKKTGIASFHEDGLGFLAARTTSFDLIHGKDIIEHLTKDEALSFCASAYQALRMEGELWLSTFNAQAPLSNSIRWGDFTHELGLTPSSAHQMLNAAGFQKIQVFGMHSPPSTAKGVARKIAYCFMERLYQFLLTLRHGKPARPEFATCLPDLFIVAIKT
jgi:2-polyprenyl-3-methyl-5-hydroxy-6-metoxy-1,4-benzoquinol methylase